MSGGSWASLPAPSGSALAFAQARAFASGHVRVRPAVSALDDVDQPGRHEGLAHTPGERPADHGVERVLEVDEASLGADPLGRLLGGQAGRDPVAQEEPDQLALGRVELHAGDDRKRGALGEIEGAVDPVVVGDRKDVEPTLGMCPLVVGQGVDGVVGAVAVVVEVEELPVRRRVHRLS